MMPFAPSMGRASRRASPGTISLKMPSWRMRRPMSCVLWPPKSRMRILSISAGSAHARPARSASDDAPGMGVRDCAGPLGRDARCSSTGSEKKVSASDAADGGQLPRQQVPQRRVLPAGPPRGVQPCLLGLQRGDPDPLVRLGVPAEGREDVRRTPRRPGPPSARCSPPSARGPPSASCSTERMRSTASANPARYSATNRDEAEFVRSRWWSEIWSMKKVITRGENAFHRLFTCSEFHGLRFCGMVEEPTCVEVNSSRTSPISERWRLRRSSARLAMMPKATLISSRSRSRYSGSTSCVECSEGARPRPSRTSRSSSSGILDQERGGVVRAHGARRACRAGLPSCPDPRMRFSEPRNVLRQGKSEGEGNGMLAVRAADLRRLRFLPAAADQLLLEVAQQRENHGAQGVPVAQRGGGVQDVGRGGAEVEERPHLLGKQPFQHVDEGADVVPGLLLLPRRPPRGRWPPPRRPGRRFRRPGGRPAGRRRSSAFRRAISTRAQYRTAASSPRMALSASNSPGLERE